MCLCFQEVDLESWEKLFLNIMLPVPGKKRFSTSYILRKKFNANINEKSLREKLSSNILYIYQVHKTQK